MRSHYAVLIFFLAILFSSTTSASTKRSTLPLDTAVCDPDKLEIDDGDTFVCNGEQIRVLGIDTPEIKHPKHGIFKDQKGGQRAAALSRKLLEGAHRVLIIRAGKDYYGRTLAHVLIDGELLGVKLINEGLAYETVSRYGDNGMPEFALQIMEASKSAPKPSFEDPHLWRKENQEK